MQGRAILIAAAAVLLLVGGLLILLLRQPDEVAPLKAPSPSPRAAEQAKLQPPRTEPVDLGAVLDLQSLTDCSQSPRLASIFERMVRIDPETFASRRGGPIAVPGFARPLVPTFERVRETGENRDIRAVTADLDLPGRWHGLAVRGLRRSFYEESDSSAVSILFAEPADRVRDTLAHQGFRLPPVGEVREVGDENEISVALGVERLDEGSALTCVTG
jgi:hypothetical protein